MHTSYMQQGSSMGASLSKDASSMALCQISS
jgi:hypothetical protein